MTNDEGDFDVMSIGWTDVIFGFGMLAEASGNNVWTSTMATSCDNQW